MEDAAGPGRDDDLARLLWGWSEPATRGPRPSLDLGRIAAETMALADSQGIDAVSMQKLADGLGVTKMALYRYVRSRDDLIAVTVEHAVGDPPEIPDDTSGWRQHVLLWAQSLRAVWLEHPWLPAATMGDRLIGPREIGWSESAARALRGSGLRGGSLRATITLLFAHARAALAADVTGTQPWNLGCDLGEEVRRRMDARVEDFPLIGPRPAAQDQPSRAFDAWSFGLRLILDGIEGSQRSDPGVPSLDR